MRLQKSDFALKLAKQERRGFRGFPAFQHKLYFPPEEFARLVFTREGYSPSAYKASRANSSGRMRTRSGHKGRVVMCELGYSAKTPFLEKDSLKRKSMKKLLTDSLIIKCYKKDIVLKFKTSKLPIHKPRQYKRSKIKRFSFLSQRRLRLFSRNTSYLWKIFITLTYPENFPQNGKLVKKHLDTFLKRLSRYSQTYNVPIYWTAILGGYGIMKIYEKSITKTKSIYRLSRS